MSLDYLTHFQPSSNKLMTDTRKQHAEQAVGQLLNESSGFALSELDQHATFGELGFDSLFLVQFGQLIKSKLKVKVTFRQLIEEIGTLSSLIDYVAANLPEDSVPAVAESPQVVSAAEESAPPVAVESDETSPKPTNASAATPASRETIPTPVAPQPSLQLQPISVSASNSTDKAALAQVIAQQNQLMALHLQMLSGGSASPNNAASTVPATVIADGSPVLSASTPANETNAVDTPAAPKASTDAETGKKTFDRFGPFKPVRKAAGGGLTNTQQKYLDRLVTRFTRRTEKSRRHAQDHRDHFADPRGVAGYRRIWKSMVYQIAVDRSKGSKLWDIDGNEYIDIAMGFGLNLFGQSPDFVNDAVAKQLKMGVEVGPQSPLAGEVADLLCQFSRKDRATFCNTGSEAVMAAMRLARTVTGKQKVVFFNKDYHGNFDQVLIRSSKIGNRRRSSPAAPGVPQEFANATIVLDYGTEEALQTIRERADEIAAVLVEPVQSADPFIQPREFLHAVREITKQNGIAMVMDEVITGFRSAPGGAQEWFDVWGDMATYGKVLGGGLPIGALTGSREYMDALDGGTWRYEDDSEPTADMTFFAGTFVRHPLAMTAAHQVLMKVKDSGPDLQKSLTDKTTYLVNSLNRFFEDEVFPIRVAQFTSLFRFMFPPSVEYADMLYFHLLDRGIFTRGWGDNCFLSTAHSDEDIERIIKAVKDSCHEIREGDFMPKPDVGVDSSKTAEPERVASPSPSMPATPSLPTANGSSTFRMSCIEEIHEEGNLPPLFCMPAADGLTLVFHELASRLGADQPVYGLNSPGAYGEPVPHTIEEMAERFIKDIREERPHGPYALIGYCSGGTIAFEVAQQLQAAGEEVSFLAGIETYDWATAQSSNRNAWVDFVHNTQRIEFLVKNFFLLDTARKLAFMRSKWDRFVSRLDVWRGKIFDLFTGGSVKSKPNAINWNQVWQAHDDQADRYRKRPYAGKLLQIRPKKDYSTYLGKEELEGTEGVSYCRIPCYPGGLMTPPFVDQVAEVVRTAIREGHQELRSTIPAPAKSDRAVMEATVMNRGPNPAM